MKTFYPFFLVLLTVCISLKGQVSVTASAGAPSGTYPTLGAAFDSINSGRHRGVIAIRINASTTEPVTARLNASGTGLARYRRINIRPTVTCAISGNIAGPLIELDGADSVTINGRISAEVPGRRLTIRNLYTQGHDSAATIKLANSARGNALRSLKIEGSAQSELGGTVLLGWGENSNNTIHNNEIRPAGGNLPYFAIHADRKSGGSTLLNENNVITNNLIHDFASVTGWSGGIVFGENSYTARTTIAGNSIYQTMPVTGSGSFPQSFILVRSYRGGDTIRNNFLGGSAPRAGGGPAVFNRQPVHGIEAWSGVINDTAVIEGNVITNFNITHTDPTSMVIFEGITTVETKCGRIKGNTIGSLTANGAITGTYTATVPGGWMVGIHCDFFSGHMVVEDNKVGGMTLNAPNAVQNNGVTLQGIAVYGAMSADVKRNTVGGPLPGSMQLNGAAGKVGGIAFYFPFDDTRHSCSQNTIQHIYNNCTGTRTAITQGILASLYPHWSLRTGINITGNRITHLHSTGTTPSDGSVSGIYRETYDPESGSDMEGVISNNQIDTLIAEAKGPATVVSGISNKCPWAFTLEIKDNVIHTLRGATDNQNMYAAPAVQGIGNYLNYGWGLNIAGNRIYDLESSATVNSTVAGAYIISNGDSTDACNLSKNQIYDLRNEQSPRGTITGVILNGDRDYGYFVLKNNMISLSANRAAVYGILHNATATRLQLYYNSVAIGGTAADSAHSAAFYRRPWVATDISSVNNIFHNTRTGGTGKHYAIRNDYAEPATGWSNSDYNDLYSSNPATIASWREIPLSFSAYRDSSGQDLSSLSIHVDFADTLIADLHLEDTDSNRLLAGIALDSIGITDDFDGDPRHDRPAMGADEILIPLPPLAAFPKMSSVAAFEDEKEKNKFILYPNPTPDILKVNLAGYKGIVTFTISDISGRERLRQKNDVSDPGTATIVVEALPAGTYLLRMITARGEVSRWFVKM